MAIKKAFVASILIIAIIASCIFYVCRGNNKDEKKQHDEKSTIRIWYTDEALTDYLNSEALSFYDETGIRVIPVYHQGLEYTDDIYKASVDNKSMPDLYIIESDLVEKSAMGGIAVPIKDSTKILNKANYPEVALNAATYNGEYFGYPFYYETSFLLYNDTYLHEVADMALRDEMSGDEDNSNISESDNAIPDGYDEASWNNAVHEKAKSMIPASIADIISFANDYSAPSDVENIFLWDVSDIFYNYFFTGAYMNVGGATGDNKGIIEIYNENTIECMEVYKDLNQFFSIESNESSYENVLNEFLSGKSIFTIATTDSLKRIEEKKTEGTFPWEYNVAALPAVDASHVAKGVSTTKMVVINGFSDKYEEADKFAKYVAFQKSDELYEKAGKLPVVSLKAGEVSDAFKYVRMAYDNSVSFPKIIEISDFWIRLEHAYTLIWNGEDANDTLRKLAEDMNFKITGTRTEIERIEIIESKDDENLEE